MLPDLSVTHPPILKPIRIRTRPWPRNMTPGSATHTQLLVAHTYIPRELTAPNPLDLKGSALQSGGGSAYDQQGSLPPSLTTASCASFALISILCPSRVPTCRWHPRPRAISHCGGALVHNLLKQNPQGETEGSTHSMPRSVVDTTAHLNPCIRKLQAT